MQYRINAKILKKLVLNKIWKVINDIYLLFYNFEIFLSCQSIEKIKNYLNK